jgi:hypothetical protein
MTTVDLSWAQLLERQCPYLYAMIQKEDKEIDAAALDDVMRKLNLQPCNPHENGTDNHECLQRNCAVLWRYYIARKHAAKSSKKWCGTTLVDPEHFTPECEDAQVIAQRIFDEKEKFVYRPGDIAVLYDLNKIDETSGAMYRLQKKRGDVILKINYNVNSAYMYGNNIMRYLLVNHQDLLNYFLNIYSLEIGTAERQPNRKLTPVTHMYLLLEAMDGSLLQFQQRFQKTDPHYENRLTRMLLHGLWGLYKLNQLGFSHNNVKLENLVYKLDWSKNLIATKWCDYDCVGLRGQKSFCQKKDQIQVSPNKKEESDQLAFGIMLQQLLNVKNIEDLLDPQLPHQPLGTVAYHFLVDHWSYESTFEYLESVSLSRDVLPALQ